MDKAETEYQKELTELREQLVQTNKYHDELVEQNEEDYCEIVYERIIQWENSITIDEQKIKIHRLEYMLSKK